ncbi:MAG: C1 family peptidase [Chitinophagaceae bacterium]|nr:C1 family peptidase [Chitinophagaceae bacterium]
MRTKLVSLVIFCSLSAHSQEDLAMGLESTCDSVAFRYIAPGAPPLSLSRLARPVSKWDLSKFLPFVGDQGLQYSCTAFSVCAALTILNNQENHKQFLRSDANATNSYFSPAFVFNVAKSKYPSPRRTACKVGISYIDAFLVVMYYGMVTWEELKYDGSNLKNCGKPVEDVTINNALKKKILTFQKPDLNNQVFQTLISDPSYGYPINISVNVDANYNDAGLNNKIWITKGSPRGQHAMCVVGFDSARHAFKVLDSRGSKWGDHGFIWIDYDLMQDRSVVFDAFVCSFDDKILNEMNLPGEGSSSIIAQDTNWVKAGYYQPFRDYRIACTEVTDTSSKFLIRDLNSGDPLTSIGAVTINDTKKFDVPGGIITINLYKVSRNRGRTKKRAAEFIVSFSSQ